MEEITVYYNFRRRTTKKAMEWLQTHGVVYKAVNVLSTPLPYEHFLLLLQFSELEKEEFPFLSTKSQLYEQLEQQLPTMTTRALYQFILDHPKVLKEPLIVSEYRVLSGFNAEEINQFKPRTNRQLAMKQLLEREFALN